VIPRSYVCGFAYTNCILQRAGDTTGSSRICLVNFAMHVCLYRDKHKCSFYRVPQRNSIFTHNACICRDISLTVAVIEDTVKGTHFFYIYMRDFSRLSGLNLGPNQPPLQWVSGLFPRGKAAEGWR